MNSDHSPILFTLIKIIIKKENNPTLVNNSTDWKSFKQKLEEKINHSEPLRTEQHLNEEVEIFINNIQKAAWESTTVVKRTTTGNNYVLEIRGLIAQT